ncbi:hypothetical protein RSAG8_13705, partial [Rhizoctonia solani AG-8 WAC10335]
MTWETNPCRSDEIELARKSCSTGQHGRRIEHALVTLDSSSPFISISSVQLSRRLASAALLPRQNNVQQDLTCPPIVDSWPACPSKYLASAVDHSHFQIPTPSQIPEFPNISDGKSPARAIPYAANSSFGRLEHHGIPSAIRGCLSSGLGQRNVDTGLSSGALLSSTGEFAPGITEPGESGAFQPSSMNDEARSAELGLRGRPYIVLENSRPGGFWRLTAIQSRYLISVSRAIRGIRDEAGGWGYRCIPDQLILLLRATMATEDVNMTI